MNRQIPQSLLLYFALLLLGVCGFFLTLFIAPPVGFYGFAAVIALGGLGVSTHIYKTKHAGGELVCPTGSNCNRVVSSKYSAFFGIPLELLGIVYFGFIALSYGLLFLDSGMISGTLLSLVALASTAAALFTLYLIFVQAVLLREWCIWCILAAIFSLTLFATSFVTLDQVGVPVRDLIQDNENIMMFLRFLGYALGVGGATSASFLFFTFLDDLDISEKESGVIKSITELVWFGFGLVLVSVMLSFATSPEMTMYSAPFTTQIIALLVAGVTGAILMMLYAPFLVFIPFHKKDSDKKNWLSSLRQPTFVAGAVSLASWYMAFALNFVPESYNRSEIFFVFGVFLLIAYFVGRVADELLKKRVIMK